MNDFSAKIKVNHNSRHGRGIVYRRLQQKSCCLKATNKSYEELLDFFDFDLLNRISKIELSSNVEKSFQDFSNLVLKKEDFVNSFLTNEK